MEAKIDNGYQHEVLHTLFIVQNNIDDYILGNPLKKDNRFKKARAKVKEAQKLLFDAYQEYAQIEF